MNILVFLVEPDSGGQIQQLANTFGVDWPHLIAQIISFAIVCILLQRFAYNPILKMLEERRRQIAQGLAETEKIRAELAETEAQRQDNHCCKPIPRRPSSSRRLTTPRPGCKQQETQKAIAAAEQILVKSREAAAQEHARMLAELKREVGQLVVQTAATVAGKILTPEDQRRMAEETVKQLTPAA